MGKNNCFCNLRMWGDSNKNRLTSLKLCFSSFLCGLRQFKTFEDHARYFDLGKLWFPTRIRSLLGLYIRQSSTQRKTLNMNISIRFSFQSKSHDDEVAILNGTLG